MGTLRTFKIFKRFLKVLTGLTSEAEFRFSLCNPTRKLLLKRKKEGKEHERIKSLKEKTKALND